MYSSINKTHSMEDLIMRNENKTLFNEMRFDDVQYARNTLTECDKKLARNKIGIIVALIVPVFDIIMATIFEKFGMTDSPIGIWIVAALVAYIIGGGLKASLKMVWRVTMVSWWLIPIFPIDLAIGATAFMMSGAIALFLPIVFVLLSRMQISKDRDAAQRYMDCCRPAREVVCEEKAIS